MRDNDKVILADAGDSKERRAFTQSELIECNACGRSNPPTRPNCLYCGAGLKTHGRRFDPHAVMPAPESGLEKSFTVVAFAKGDAAVEESAWGRAADLVALSTRDLRAVTSATRGAPFYCTNTAEQAEVIRERMRELAIPAITISDDELNLDKPVRELRSLEFDDDSLYAALRPGAERVSAKWEDLGLLVLGRVQITTLEVEQKQNRRQTHLIEEREMTSVEPILDLYFDGNEGWRIRSGNFDFSCLGKDKAITAFENFGALVEVFKRRAGNAEFDDSFLRLRSVLNKVWPVEEGCVRTENRRTAMRRYEASVVNSDNESQFTRYSRLLQVLKMRQLENN